MEKEEGYAHGGKVANLVVDCRVRVRVMVRADRLRGNVQMLRRSIQCERSLRMKAQVYALIKDGYWLLK